MKHLLTLQLVILCALWLCGSQTLPAPQPAEWSLLDRYRTLRDRGIELANRGDYQNALAAFEQTLGLARQSGDPGLQAKATFNVGLTLSNLGQYKAALETLQRVLEIIAQHALPEPDLRANALVNIALIYGDDDLQTQGDVNLELPSHERKKTAIAYAERALPDLQGVRKADVLAQLGAWVAPNRSADVQKALRYLAEAATLYREADELASFANTQLGIGTLLQDAHRLDEAASAYEAALQSLPSAGSEAKRAEILASYASALKRSGDAAKALAFYRDAFQLYRSIGQNDLAADVAGRMLLTPGAQALSESEREQLWNVLLAPTSSLFRGPLRSRAALIAIAEGRLSPAETLAEEAQAVYEQRGDRDGQMRARASLGWIRELQGR